MDQAIHTETEVAECEERVGGSFSAGVIASTDVKGLALSRNENISNA